LWRHKIDFSSTIVGISGIPLLLSLFKTLSSSLYRTTVEKSSSFIYKSFRIFKPTKYDVMTLFFFIQKKKKKIYISVYDKIM